MNTIPPSREQMFLAAQSLCPLTLDPAAALPASVAALPGEFLIQAAAEWAALPSGSLLTNLRLILRRGEVFDLVRLRTVTNVHWSQEAAQRGSLHLRFADGRHYGPIPVTSRATESLAGHLMQLTLAAQRIPALLADPALALGELQRQGILNEAEYKAARERLARRGRG